MSSLGQKIKLKRLNEGDDVENFLERYKIFQKFLKPTLDGTKKDVVLNSLKTEIEKKKQENAQQETRYNKIIDEFTNLDKDADLSETNAFVNTLNILFEKKQKNISNYGHAISKRLGVDGKIQLWVSDRDDKTFGSLYIGNLWRSSDSWRQIHTILFLYFLSLNENDLDQNLIDVLLATINLPNRQREKPKGVILKENFRDEEIEAVPSTTESLITPTNVKWLRELGGTCPFDALFTGLFKVPGLWLEGAIKNATVVYPTKEDCDDKRVTNIHKEIWKRIKHLRGNSSEDPKNVCITGQEWRNCVIPYLDGDDDSDKSGDDPRVLFPNLLRFYGIDISNIDHNVQNNTIPENFVLDSDNAYNGNDQDNIPLMYQLYRQTFTGKIKVPLEISDLLTESKKTLLCCFVYHKNEFHWVSYVRDPRDGMWWKFDDYNNKQEKLSREMPPSVYQETVIQKITNKGEKIDITEVPLGWVYAKIPKEVAEKAADEEEEEDESSSAKVDDRNKDNDEEEDQDENEEEEEEEDSSSTVVLDEDQDEKDQRESTPPLPDPVEEYLSGLTAILGKLASSKKREQLASHSDSLQTFLSEKRDNDNVPHELQLRVFRKLKELGLIVPNDNVNDTDKEYIKGVLVKLKKLLENVNAFEEIPNEEVDKNRVEQAAENVVESFREVEEAIVDPQSGPNPNDVNPVVLQDLFEGLSDLEIISPDLSSVVEGRNLLERHLQKGTVDALAYLEEFVNGGIPDVVYDAWNDAEIIEQAITKFPVRLIPPGWVDTTYSARRIEIIANLKNANRKAYPQLELYDAGSKGQGVKAARDILPHEIIPYLGPIYPLKLSKYLGKEYDKIVQIGNTDEVVVGDIMNPENPNIAAFINQANEDEQDNCQLVEVLETAERDLYEAGIRVYIQVYADVTIKKGEPLLLKYGGDLGEELVGEPEKQTSKRVTPTVDDLIEARNIEALKKLSDKNEKGEKRFQNLNPQQKHLVLDTVNGHVIKRYKSKREREHTKAFFNGENGNKHLVKVIDRSDYGIITEYLGGYVTLGSALTTLKSNLSNSGYLLKALDDAFESLNHWYMDLRNTSNIMVNEDAVKNQEIPFDIRFIEGGKKAQGAHDVDKGNHQRLLRFLDLSDSDLGGNKTAKQLRDGQYAIRDLLKDFSSGEDFSSQEPPQTTEPKKRGGVLGWLGFETEIKE